MQNYRVSFVITSALILSTCTSSTLNIKVLKKSECKTRTKFVSFILLLKSILNDVLKILKKWKDSVTIFVLGRQHSKCRYSVERNVILPYLDSRSQSLSTRNINTEINTNNNSFSFAALVFFVLNVNKGKAAQQLCNSAMQTAFYTFDPPSCFMLKFSLVLNHHHNQKQSITLVGKNHLSR